MNQRRITKELAMNSMEIHDHHYSSKEISLAIRLGKNSVSITEIMPTFGGLLSLT
jgi:hypothetical protein